MRLLHLPLISIVLLIAPFAFAAPNDPLQSGFLNPPDSARPQTWWQWMNGNITKEGITADLEAMKQIGLSGATIVNVDCGIPPGPVTFMSPEWREDFNFAVQEANRVGLKLCVANCAGWSNSGGPWNTATNAMQCLTSSETRVHGAAAFDAALPQPATKLGYYRDIAVLAFRTPAAKPDVASSANPATGKLEIKRAVYQSPDGSATLDVTARIIALIKSGRTSVGATTGEMGGDPAPGEVKQVRLDFLLDGEAGTLTIDEGGPLIFPVNARQLAAARKFEKTAMNTTFVQPPPATDAPEKEPIPRDSIIDLTSKLETDGHLRWDVPPGDWTILRIGHTPIGVENHPAPNGGAGLECDKLSKSALDAHWDGFMKKVLDDAGPLAGKALEASLIDSYEVGNQDWTANFREEFRKRRGYDPLKFLPTFTRQVVDSPAVTERFLWDMRRTVADLFAENYYGHFAELCRRHGLTSATEPYFGPYESMQCGARVDVVMGEFWAGSQGNPTVKMAASIAHTYGKAIVGAESFTASAAAGRWLNDPYSMKALGDLMFCQGLNQIVFHRYAMQPWTNRWPGMTMGEYGIHFERTLTWWGQGKSWIDYLSRCEFLLRQGRAVADAAYFTGESSPVVMRVGQPALPFGCDYDAVNADVLLHGATVKKGRVTLASGANYAAIILPPADSNLTPPMMECLRKLVRAGATVVGPRPQHSPSLTEFPACDVRVKKIADELWGKCDGQIVFENSVGKGRVVWGQPLAEIFARSHLRPDFEFTGSATNIHLAYCHRIAGATDLYFVSNQRQQFASAECLFRVTGKTPELWHPDTGVIEPAPIWHEENGSTKVQLNFDPAGSVFVIFRQAAGHADHLITARNSLVSEAAAQPALEIQRAFYAAIDHTGAPLDVTAKVSDAVHDSQLVITASSAVLGGDPAPYHVKELRVDYAFGGKPAHAVARESSTLALPAVPFLGAPPQMETLVAKDGSPVVKAWCDGEIELHTARGKTLRATASVPRAREISGEWKLSFPPNWGAPASVLLEKLISWPEHTNNGVRYFAGTATYEKKIEISSDALKAGRELWLDLGAVKNFAEVSLNDRDLGMLWKPPFRVNISSAAKPGVNKLEIKVTNLWPNRLIGDEQLPPDCEWNGDALKSWPQWLAEGKPSPSGRLTFTTWRHWEKDSQLLDSGLLGPVTLRSAEMLTQFSVGE